MKNFRTCNMARALYLKCKELKLKGEARNQLERASLSIVLNLAEGSGKLSAGEKKRFYGIALGSMREVQALVSLFGTPEMADQADHLAACLWNLIRAT